MEVLLRMPHCRWAVGGGSAFVQCPTACAQMVVELLLLTASVLVGSGQWNPPGKLLHCSMQWTSFNTRLCP